MKLKEIATLNTGLVLNRKKAKLEEEFLKKYKLITLKSIDSKGFINNSQLEEFSSKEELGENYITRAGDVVIRLSEPNTAVFIQKQDENLLISSQFCLIRTKIDKINPKYLAWYLNSSYAKREIKRSLIGSTISIIKTSFLNELNIKKISMSDQKKVIEINDLTLREELLTLKLLEERKKLSDEMIDKIINKGERNGN